MEDALPPSVTVHQQARWGIVVFVTNGEPYIPTYIITHTRSHTQRERGRGRERERERERERGGGRERERGGGERDQHPHDKAWKTEPSLTHSWKTLASPTCSH